MLGSGCKWHYLFDKTIEVGGVERFFQVSFGPKLQSAQSVFFLPLGANYDYRDLVWQTGFGSLFKKLNAIHDRHVNIKQYELNVVLQRKNIQSFLAVHRVNDLTFVARHDKAIHL